MSKKLFQELACGITGEAADRDELLCGLQPSHNTRPREKMGYADLFANVSKGSNHKPIYCQQFIDSVERHTQLSQLPANQTFVVIVLCFRNLGHHPWAFVINPYRHPHAFGSNQERRGLIENAKRLENTGMATPFVDESDDWDETDQTIIGPAQVDVT